MKYRYFVSYHGFMKSGARSVGRTSVTIDHPIRNDDDVSEIELAIAQHNGFANVVLSNFVQFESEEAATP